LNLNPSRQPLVGEEEPVAGEGNRLPPAVAPELHSIAKKGKNSHIHSKFDCGHPHGQIRAKRTTDEAKTVGKARWYCREKN